MDEAQRMKILVLCYEYPPVGGGGGRVAAQVAEALAARGHEVKVMTAGLKHLPRRETKNGVEILRPESFRKREDTCSVPEMGLYLATSFFPTLRLCETWKPDVIHAHFAMPTGLLAEWMPRLTGVPYVLTAHLGDVPGGVPEQTSHLFDIVAPLAREVWDNAAAVTAVSGHVAALADAAYGISPQVILNGRPAISGTGVKDASPRILFVGRFSVQKNPLLAIRSLALVRDLPWTFEMIGDGPLAEESKAEVRRLELEDRVMFSGWLDAGEVSARMGRASVLLMTSLHEGLPMVAVEALQHGLAIVSSDIGGMHDVVAHRVNGLVCAQNERAFAGALREVISTPELRARYGKASSEMARGFELSRTIAAYEDVLREAAKARF
jgi:glycosyltransferase involved in cell wall biosynthesis